MKDALLDFGAISAFGASSAVTYCANVLDLGYAGDHHFGSDVPAKVVFTATAATTGFTPMLFSGSTTTPTTVYAQGPTVSSLAVGDTVELLVPIKVLRYLRAGGTATATSGAVTAHIELGGSED